MLGVTFLYFFLMVSAVLITYAIISYSFPNSLPGRIATIMRG